MPFSLSGHNAVIHSIYGFEQIYICHSFKARVLRMSHHAEMVKH